MKTIAEIYSDYKILPNLQLHQLRVAGVAKIICDVINAAAPGKVDSDSVITTCLLHDMGNIIKINLDRYAFSFEPEDEGYWQNVKKDFIEKYGPEEHIATRKICKELGVSDEVLRLLDQIGFSNLDKALENPSLEQKICSYSDMRVGLHGVISIDQRVEDGIKRYQGTSHTIASGRAPFLAECLRRIEGVIFEGLNLLPSDIDDAAVDMAREGLLQRLAKTP